MRTHFFWVLATLIITACNNKQKENDNTASDDSKIWNELPTVAAEVKTNGTTLMVCDWTAVKDSIHLPLSYFIEDLEIVKLDNKDEALVRNSSVTVSDNYILIHCSQNIPFKLFDRKGKFLRNIGSVGNGPGEYVYLSSVVYHPKDSTIRVFDNGSHKYIIYSKEGKLFREINLVDSELNYLLHAEGDTYFCSGSFSNGKSEIIVSDTALRVKSSILPFDPTDDYVTRGGIMLTTSVQRCGPKLCLFNHIYSDSVFLLTPDGLKPEFILRKGKYAPSLDDVKQFMKWNKNDSFAKGFSIKTFPGYYLVQYSYKDKFFGEIWSKETNQIVSRTVLTRPDMFSSYRGIPYRFPSGTTIKLLPAYINGNKIAFFIPADEAAGEIPGVKISEDDNPIVMILEL